MKVINVQPIAATGVGRKDGSKADEYVVEQVVRSYQGDYFNRDSVNIGADTESTVNITVPAGDVVILYDYYTTCPAMTLITFTIQNVVDAVVTDVFKQQSYQQNLVHLEKGRLFTDTVRLLIKNWADKALDFEYGLCGIQISEESYYQQV